MADGGLQGQLEFYFSDANLSKSKFMMAEIAKDLTGQGCAHS